MSAVETVSRHTWRTRSIIISILNITMLLPCYTLLLLFNTSIPFISYIRINHYHHHIMIDWHEQGVYAGYATYTRAVRSVWRSTARVAIYITNNRRCAQCCHAGAQQEVPPPMPSRSCAHAIFRQQPASTSLTAQHAHGETSSSTERERRGSSSTEAAGMLFRIIEWHRSITSPDEQRTIISALPPRYILHFSFIILHCLRHHTSSLSSSTQKNAQFCQNMEYATLNR